MPVDKSIFLDKVKKIFDEGMTEAFTEGMIAGINSENQSYSSTNVTIGVTNTINKMAKKAADAAAEHFVDVVSERLVDAIDEYIRLIIKNTVATLNVQVKNIALTSSSGGGPVAGSVNITPGDLKIQ